MLIVFPSHVFFVLALVHKKIEKPDIIVAQHNYLDYIIVVVIIYYYAAELIYENILHIT